MDPKNQLPLNEQSIKEASKGKKTPIWKKILCGVLVLFWVYYFASLFYYSEIRLDIIYGLPIPIMYNLTQFGIPLLLSFITIWGASFLWAGWRFVLGVGCIAWGVIYLRVGIPDYILQKRCESYIDSFAFVEPKGNIVIGSIIMLVGVAFLCFDLFRGFVKKGTPTIYRDRGGWGGREYGVNTA